MFVVLIVGMLSMSACWWHQTACYRKSGHPQENNINLQSCYSLACLKWQHPSRSLCWCGKLWWHLQGHYTSIYFLAAGVHDLEALCVEATISIAWQRLDKRVDGAATPVARKYMLLCPLFCIKLFGCTLAFLWLLCMQHMMTSQPLHFSGCYGASPPVA